MKASSSETLQNMVKKKVLTGEVDENTTWNGIASLFPWTQEESESTFCFIITLFGHPPSENETL